MDADAPLTDDDCTIIIGWAFRRDHAPPLSAYPLRNQTVSIKNALLFGLGHGLMEVLLVLGPVINHDFLTLFPALFERFFAVLAHMGLSLLIFSMANVGRSALAWLYAVIMHFLLNIGAVVILRFTGSVLFSEIWIAVVSVFIFGTAWRQAKFMERKLQ